MQMTESGNRLQPVDHDHRTDPFPDERPRKNAARKVPPLLPTRQSERRRQPNRRYMNAPRFSALAPVGNGGHLEANLTKTTTT